MKTKKVYTDKTCIVKRDTLLTFMLPSHNTRKFLLYFDEETGTNRALRYA